MVMSCLYILLISPRRATLNFMVLGSLYSLIFHLPSLYGDTCFFKLSFFGFCNPTPLDPYFCTFSGFLVSSLYFIWPLNICVFYGSDQGHTSNYGNDIPSIHYKGSQNYKTSTHLSLSSQTQSLNCQLGNQQPPQTP